LARPDPALRLWAAALHRLEHAPTDDRWPAPTFGRDFAHGLELYRANVRGRLRRPVARRTDVPVQILIPARDRYVTPELLDGLENWGERVWRRTVEGGHWAIRANPVAVARAVQELVDYVEEGAETEGLRRARLT